MENNNSSHLSCGELIALAIIGQNIDASHRVKQHLTECDSCSKKYQIVCKIQQSLLKNSNNWHPAFSNNCKHTEPDFTQSTQIMFGFLNVKLKKAESLKLFQHLNDCFNCFQLFARNWSDFLAMNQCKDKDQ